ncbi:MAG: sugar phosphate nucleotidyltransferase, partial [Verrucomicrobiota bacterium]
SKTPKQLLSLVGDKPLIAQAVDRLAGFIPPERVLIITNADLVEGTCACVPEVPAENVIGEPVGRDTAAAVALACGLVKKRDPGTAFCILTADHIIGQNDLFQQTLREALELAVEQDVLITMGIDPTFPSTGYGYIETGEAVEQPGEIPVFRAERFVEKPDRATAEEYIASGTFFWNSGMFIWSVRSIEKAFKAFQPELYAKVDALQPHIGEASFEEALAEAYADLTRISVDYAIMEPSQNILMAKGMYPWDDVGSWTALKNHFDETDDGNVVIGHAQTVDASNNVVVSKDHLVALIGVDDLVVVHAEGATLVCTKEREQDVKKMVQQLRSIEDYQDLL